MRVIVINDFGHVNGGAAKVALASAEALQARGHAVTLFAAVAPYDARVPTVGTHQHDLLSHPNRLAAAAQGVWNAKAGRALGALLAASPRGETVVHVHGWVKALSPSVVAAATASGIPVVVTLHDYFAACPNGGFYDYQAGQPCERTPLSRACLAARCDARSHTHKLWRVARQFVQNKYGALERVSGFIAVSGFSLRLLKPHLPARVPVFTIGNPIDLEQDAPVDAAANRDVVYVGRLSAEKGPELLAAAAQAAGVRAVFVGDGERREALRLSFPGAEYTGWLDAAGVRARMRGARALVLPSRWYETEGLVVLEALAQGVPVVCAAPTAAAELVAPGETGLHFQRGDAAGLAAALHLLGDGDLVRRLGATAYARYWAAPRTLERHAEALEQVYANVLGGALHAAA